MPRIRMLTLAAGPKGVRQPGEELEVSDEAAAELLTARAAVVIDAPVKREAAVMQPPERAVAPAPEPRNPRRR